MIHVTINGKPVEVSEGSTIMEAAETVGIRIPSLCHMKNVHQYFSCRICVVEVEGMMSSETESSSSVSSSDSTSGNRLAFKYKRGKSFVALSTKSKSPVFPAVSTKVQYSSATVTNSSVLRSYIGFSSFSMCLFV